MIIDGSELDHKQLNELVYRKMNNGAKQIILDNINGQRYIGAGLSKDVKIIINGVPGNDLACFMDGPTIIVNSNGQDAIGNTMNAGKVIIHGDAGDITGHSMRGGKIYIKGNAGFRAGIHMKSYKDSYPVIIIGGAAGDFLGEYMAGGLIIVLGLSREESTSIVGSYCGTGMHGGRIYLRGMVEDYRLGKEARLYEPDKEDKQTLDFYLREYCRDFGLGPKQILRHKFIKLLPATHRPYGRLYAY